MRRVIAVEMHGRRQALALRRLLEVVLGIIVGQFGCNVAKATDADTTRDEGAPILGSDLRRANLGIVRPVRRMSVVQRRGL